MNKKVAVEENLTNVEDALKTAGFETVAFASNPNLNNVGAIVISGQDQNFLGMHDTESKIPVISAEGRTANEVVDQVKNRIH